MRAVNPSPASRAAEFARVLAPAGEPASPTSLSPPPDSTSGYPGWPAKSPASLAPSPLERLAEEAVKQSSDVGRLRGACGARGHHDHPGGQGWLRRRRGTQAGRGRAGRGRWRLGRSGRLYRDQGQERRVQADPLVDVIVPLATLVAGFAPPRMVRRLLRRR